MRLRRAHPSHQDHLILMLSSMFTVPNLFGAWHWSNQIGPGVGHGRNTVVLTSLYIFFRSKWFIVMGAMHINSAAMGSIRIVQSQTLAKVGHPTSTFTCKGGTSWCQPKECKTRSGQSTENFIEACKASIGFEDLVFLDGLSLFICKVFLCFTSPVHLLSECSSSCLVGGEVEVTGEGFCTLCFLHFACTDLPFSTTSLTLGASSYLLFSAFASSLCLFSSSSFCFSTWAVRSSSYVSHPSTSLFCSPTSSFCPSGLLMSTALLPPFPSPVWLDSSMSNLALITSTSTKTNSNFCMPSNETPWAAWGQPGKPLQKYGFLLGDTSGPRSMQPKLGVQGVTWDQVPTVKISQVCNVLENDIYLDQQAERLLHEHHIAWILAKITEKCRLIAPLSCWAAGFTFPSLLGRPWLKAQRPAACRPRCVEGTISRAWQTVVTFLVWFVIVTAVVWGTVNIDINSLMPMAPRLVLGGVWHIFGLILDEL